ncbi:MAG: Asp-tRNA(Asn)/Glu-tRNA(Gln) amidotransferase subunit GatB [Parcubacteria group bacterium]
MKYDIIIGLEIHAELKTKSKMFCSCNNLSDGLKANTAICPICLGHPGTMPVANFEAIKWTILCGLALNCKINKYSKFDRKNYFYPDLPKGYQISQYDLPLCYDGKLEIDGRNIDITRIHLEEDTGKLIHIGGDSIIDFNRAGTPLMEMVTEPVIKSAQEAKKFCQRYQQVLRYLKISSADMEKGEMRCEANISLQEKGSWEYLRDGIITAKKGKALNPKVELKNLNSFKAIEKGIEYEIQEQAKKLDNGEDLEPETKGWDEKKQITIRQRKKESSADYRYFPEPDIPPIKITTELLNEIKQNLIELPQAKIKRFKKQYGFTEEMSETIVFDKEVANWIEQVISELRAWIDASDDSWERQNKKLCKSAYNLLTTGLFQYLKKDKKSISDIKITAENFAELITLHYQGKINSTTLYDILKEMYKKGGDPTDIMEEKGLEQIDSEEKLKEVIAEIIKNYPKEFQEYKKGKEALLKFFIGQTMAKTKGKANPNKIQEILKEELSK